MITTTFVQSTTISYSHRLATVEDTSAIAFQKSVSSPFRIFVASTLTFLEQTSSMTTIKNFSIAIFGAAVLALGTANTAQAANFTFSINPKATFLRTNQDPEALNTTPIELKTLGISGGDVIRIEQIGDISYYNKPALIWDGITNMIGVFSASDVLLPSYIQNRVPDAIDAGEDVFVIPTYYGSLPINIPEDFLIKDTTITVPTSATHLFVAVPDILYSENIDPDGDYAVRISTTSKSVPEPTSILGLLAFGISTRVLPKRK